jgi:hypothetical protein
MFFVVQKEAALYFTPKSASKKIQSLPPSYGHESKERVLKRTII